MPVCGPVMGLSNTLARLTEQLLASGAQLLQHPGVIYQSAGEPLGHLERLMAAA